MCYVASRPGCAVWAFAWHSQCPELGGKVVLGQRGPLQGEGKSDSTLVSAHPAELCGQASSQSSPWPSACPCEGTKPARAGTTLPRDYTPQGCEGTPRSHAINQESCCPFPDVSRGWKKGNGKQGVNVTLGPHVHQAQRCLREHSGTSG